MAKTLKTIPVARAAAEAAQACNTNPHPRSVPAERHEWFKGYDETTALAGSRRKPT